MSRKVVLFFTIVIYFCLCTSNVYTQISIILQQPPPGQLNTEHLWVFNITNSSQADYNVYIHGTAEESSEGLIFEGNTQTFTLLAGYSGPISLSDISPVEVDYTNDDYEDILRRTGSVPEGTYEVCLFVINADNEEELNYHCITQQVIHPSPPQLISPQNETVIEDALPVFVWMPPILTTLGNMITYNLTIMEILDGQTAIEAMEANPAWFTEEGIPATTFQYPNYADEFGQGLTYAWKVKAISGDALVIGESQVWSFNYGAAAVVSYEEPAFLELIYPLDGEVIDGPFEWSPIDTTTEVTVTLTVAPTVTPEVYYNLIIWQLSEDPTEIVVEGYTLTEEDLSELDPYFVKEGIEETSFVYSDTTDYPLMPGLSYCWQVTGWMGDWKVAESEVWSFKFGEEVELQLQEIVLEYFDPDTIEIGEETDVTLVGRGFTPDMYFLIPYDDMHITNTQFISSQSFKLRFKVDTINEPGTYPTKVIGPDGKTYSKSINTIKEECKKILKQIQDKKDEIKKAKEKCEGLQHQKNAIIAKLNIINQKKRNVDVSQRQLNNDLNAQKRALAETEKKIKKLIDRTFYCDFIGSDPSKGNNKIDLGGGVYIYFSGSENSLYWLRWFLREYKEELKKLSEDIKEAKQNLDKLNGKINNNNVKLANLQAQINQCNKELVPINGKLKECNNEVAKLEKELQELLNKHKYCTSWLKKKIDAEKKIEEAKDSLKTAKSQIEEAENKTGPAGNPKADSIIAGAKNKYQQAKKYLDEAYKALEDGDLEKAKAKANKATDKAEKAKKDALDAAAEIECSPEGTEKFEIFKTGCFRIIDKDSEIEIRNPLSKDKVLWTMLGREAIIKISEGIFKKILKKAFPFGLLETHKYAFEIKIPLKIYNVSCTKIYICKQGKWQLKEIRKDVQLSGKEVDYTDLVVGLTGYYGLYEYLARRINDYTDQQNEFDKFKCE